VLDRIAEGAGERKRVKEEERLARLRESRERVEAEKRERLHAEHQMQARPVDGGRTVVTEDRGTGGYAAPEPTSRRSGRSLKERGGLVGIVRRRLHRR